MPPDVSVRSGCLGTAEVKLWSNCAHVTGGFIPVFGPFLTLTRFDTYCGVTPTHSLRERLA